MQPATSKEKAPLESVTEERDRLASAHQDLAARLRETEAALARRDHEAREIAEEARQFAYSASHDLQEPLRSVTSYAQLLERTVPSDSEAAEFARYIVEGTARMNCLIRDLLSYSRLNDSPRLAAVSLEGIAQGAALFLQADLQKAGATLTMDALPEVVGDESQLSQLLVELLRNAIKFRSGRPLEIRICSKEENGVHLISLCDNGQGIDAKYQEQIFGVFKRLHGRDVPGTGIGLALCRKIIKGHGGRIWVESDGSSGSTFHFTLPA